MASKQESYLEVVLGIHSPWGIQDVIIDEKNQCLEVRVEPVNDKKLFTFGSKSKASDSGSYGSNRRWRHINIGNYGCYITTSSGLGEVFGANRDNDSPMFLGESIRDYTRQLGQQISLAELRGLAAPAIASTFALNEKMVALILDDAKKASLAGNKVSFLPSESEAIWRLIITDKVHLSTKVFPLKLMLSKLKLAAVGSEDIEKQRRATRELRQFFVANSSILQNEYDQVCGFSKKKTDVEARRKATTKLRLPGLKSNVWPALLTGRIALKSKNMSFNLLLVRQKSAYMVASSYEEKLVVASAIREFFRKNARQLVPELIKINRLLTKRAAAANELPDAQHSVWRRMLSDDSYLKSDHMAYRLLLSKLRSTLTSDSNRNSELEAARKLRQFMSHHQGSMKNEYLMLVNLSKAS